MVGGDAVGSSGHWRSVGRSALGGVLVESRRGVVAGWVTRQADLGVRDRRACDLEICKSESRQPSQYFARAHARAGRSRLAANHQTQGEAQCLEALNRHPSEGASAPPLGGASCPHRRYSLLPRPAKKPSEAL
ncbi:hypothetical protein Ae263Ps1_6364 [Pseudonocardia sp. Ae263_Ps1]|nr:hypothetical protein Ae263Ps1_6364 [Pseudonocardia sp. Ae263_Ps1]